jgi:hypothetical protein
MLSINFDHNERSGGPPSAFPGSLRALTFVPRRGTSSSALGCPSSGTPEAEVQMQSGIESCQHQLSHPPELVTDAKGLSHLIFECVLCGSIISLRLNSDGDVDEEAVFPPARKLA